VSEAATAGATGIGSLPGTDVREAAAQVFGELPWPHLPELPERGPGSEMVGRTGALLVDLPLETTSHGWRMASRPGRDLRRSAALLSQDLDAVEEIGQGYVGPLKLQVAGPWTLASAVELRSGHRALVDAGACRDLADSLAEGVRRHVADVAGRVPGATVTVQLDEPSLPAVLAGTIPTASGFGAVRAIDPAAASRLLATVVDAVNQLGAPAVVHCCAPGVPWGLLLDLPVSGAAVDLAQLSEADDELVGEWLDRGRLVLAGALATDVGHRGPAREVAAVVRSFVRRSGFGVPEVLSRVVVTPACGLAGLAPEDARTVMATIREAAEQLAADPDGEDGRR
jgi:methionine synthase II (cobalamin-independent)